MDNNDYNIYVVVINLLRSSSQGMSEGIIWRWNMKCICTKIRAACFKTSRYVSMISKEDQEGLLEECLCTVRQYACQMECCLVRNVFFKLRCRKKDIWLTLYNMLLICFWRWKIILCHQKRTMSCVSSQIFFEIRHLRYCCYRQTTHSGILPYRRTQKWTQGFIFIWNGSIYFKYSS